MEKQYRDWLGILALAICIIVWAQISRSLFIRTYSESMMYEIFFNAFALAPISYIVSIFAAVVKRLYGRSHFGVAEVALLGSLLPAGIFFSQDIPQRIYGSAELAMACALGALVLPVIVAVVSCRLARRYEGYTS